MTTIRTSFSKKNLRSISNQYIKYFTASGIDKMRYSTFKDNEHTIIESINKKVLNGTYNFTRYKELLLLKDKHSLPRSVVIPSLRDRLCLKALHQYLAHFFANAANQPLPHECIKELKHSLEEDDFDYFIKLDIENFYGNINHFKLFQDLRKNVSNKKVLSLIKSALETPSYPETTRVVKGIHQGLPISNILAHIYLEELDQKMKNKTNLFYCRYVDDILILCHHSNKDSILKDILYDLQRNYMLNTNEKKFNEGYLKKTKNNSLFNFLGYEIKTNKEKKYLVSVSKKNAQLKEQKLINKLIKYKHMPSKDKNINSLIFDINLSITGAMSKKVNNDSEKTRRYGWVFYYSQINDYSVIYKLDDFLHKKVIQLFNNEEREKILNELKSFSTTFFEIKYRVGSTRYIFQPDLFDRKQQIEFLNNIFDLRLPTNLSDETVSKIFRKYTYKKISQEEKDLITGRS